MNILRSVLCKEERPLLAFLGANVSLEGGRAWVVNLNRSLEQLMPFFNNALVIVQVAVAVATLVYICLKIRRVLRSR